MRLVVVAIAIVLATAARAGADVDWAAGLVTAEGVGIADRHAPSPAAAREPARRMAEQAARSALAGAIQTIPLAEGGTLSARRAASPALARRLAGVVERAFTLAATPETDGSWTVKLAVPLEAIRLAVQGAPRALAAAGDDAPPVVIVEGVTVKPALGYAIGDTPGAVVWRRDVPAWAKAAPRVKATGVRPGRIDVPRGTGGPSTLFLVLARS